MEIIPLITLKNRKNLDEKSTTFNKLIDSSDETQTLYILDLDGIEKNKPNLCIYQKISKNFELWIDNGPRNLGDVVDVFMAGATAITLRRNLRMQLDIPSIREISENKIFMNFDLEKSQINYDEFSNVDGFVNFNKKDKIEQCSFLKELSTKNKIYSYEDDEKNIDYWETQGVTGILVDIDKVEGFKKWIQNKKSL